MTPPEKASRDPSAASWATLVVLGLLASLFALFLWSELVLARQGGTPFCSTTGTAGCAALWDSPLASEVHRFTGLPIAAWGLVWGLVAFVMPLMGLLAMAEGKPAVLWVSATRVAAAAGVLGVLVLATVSALERTFCIGCFAFYVLLAGYAGIALLGWNEVPLAEVVRGGAIAMGAAAAAFALLLVPGQRTPGAASEGSLSALPSGRGPAAWGESEREQALKELIDSLDAESRQSLADTLASFRLQKALPMAPKRALLGPEDAPVRIAEFTDILCPHCAALEKDLEAISRSAPPGSFAIEPRQFPLDRECNPLVERTGSPVRCLAAKVRICAEGRPDAPSLTRSLFDNQDKLTVERVFTLAGRYMPRSDLEACLKSPETARSLADDIRYAGHYRPDGTPIVLVNGRLAPSFGPLLYALVLTGGEPSDPAFDALPAPSPDARPH